MNYRRHRGNTAQHLGTGIFPKSLFVIFTFLGAVLIALVKGFNFPSLLGIIIPVFLIVSYCVVAANVRLFYVREDQIGDNAYYMGFLFTLSSLSVALIKLQYDPNNLESIIGSFGTALWSTIAGIALRVFFSQIRQDPQDIEKDARVKIAQTASILTSELHQASVSFNNYTRGLQQSVEEAVSQAGKIVNDNIAENVTSFSEMSKNVASHIDRVFGEFLNHAEKISATSEKTVQALEALNQRIENIEAPGNSLNDTMKNVLIGAEDSSKKLTKAIDKQIIAVEKANTSSTIFLETVTSLNSQMADIERHAASFNYGAQNVDALIQNLNALTFPVSNLTETFSTLSEKHTEAIDRIAQHSNELQDQLEKSRRYTDETHNSLVSMTRTLAEKLQ